MTNKTERYFVVSEAELEIMTTHPFGPKLDAAEAACRAREVPEWAEYFTSHPHYIPRYGAYAIEKLERIKK